MHKKLVLASGNAGKAAEFRAILAPLGFEIVLQKDLGVIAPEETGKSFVENALLKARAASEQTGLPALADDSGLCVDALGGQPGIYSARFAGEHGHDGENNSKLLELLSPYQKVSERTAAFWCALCLMHGPEDPVPLIAQASWQGSIAFAPRGQNGFGYDPIFEVTGRHLTAAQLPAEVKNLISHRGRASAMLYALLQTELAGS
ncbi:MAG: RdgB/HAM1 family non-canonical purine NTP pyrophosphatase [Succinivibrio sp.]|nr:RdgB/HAM1 family non-canonical purine NTP pyrophosphatase [Succinivibrio sp.]